MLECRNLKAFTHGVDELVKAYKEESTEDTTEKEDQLQMYSMGYETTEPKPFFDVMGEVLGRKTARSLSGKIGFFFAMSYRNKT